MGEIPEKFIFGGIQKMNAIERIETSGSINIDASKIAKVYYFKDETELFLRRTELWVKLYGETGIRRMRYTVKTIKDTDMITVTKQRVSEFDVEDFKYYMKANKLFVRRIYSNPEVDLIKSLHDDILMRNFVY